MKWTDAPGGSKVLKLGLGEIRTMRTGRFLDELGKGKDKEMFMVVADLASGIQFWFSDIDWKCRGDFPVRKAFAWAKILDRLSCDMRDGLETLCLCEQYEEDSGKTKYEWEVEPRRGIKDPTGSRGWSRNMDAAGNAMARKLLPFLKPESTRRLEADLAGRDFVSDAEWKRKFSTKKPLKL